MYDPDIELVLRVIVAGDRQAFGELVKRHQSGVRNLMRRLTLGDEMRADDLAQETFIKAYKAITKFRGCAKFSTWLYRVAYNVFLDDMRKMKTMVSYDEIHSEESVASTQGGSDFEHDLQYAMTHLKQDQIAVFDLYYKKGMSHSEVSDCLSMPLGTVKTHINRGLETLRTRLKDWSIHERTT